MSTRSKTRQQRKLKALATNTSNAVAHKRLLEGRGLAEVCPAYDFCISSILQQYGIDSNAAAPAAASAATTQKTAKAASAAAAFNGAGSWTPSAALIASIKSSSTSSKINEAGENDDFHSMKLSRLLCTTLARELAKGTASAAAAGGLPTRISRLIAEQQDKDVIQHSVAAVLADEIVAKKRRAVWLVNDEKTRQSAADLLTDVFGIAADSFCVLSTGSRKALESDALFGSASKGGNQDLVIVLSSPDAARANSVLRDIIVKKLAEEASQFASLRAVFVAAAGDVARKIQLSAGTGLTPPPTPISTQLSQPAFAALSSQSDLHLLGDRSASSVATAPPPPPPQLNSGSTAAFASSSSAQPAAAAPAAAAKKLHFAVVDGFGSFFALCKLIQNLALGTKLVVHFSTPATAMFFVDAYFALTTQSDSLFGQGAAGLMLVCDAEDYPKRGEYIADGVFMKSYEEALQAHVEAAAKRFTAIPGHMRRAVFVSGFGHVPAISAPGQQHNVSGIFVQADTFPDLALSVSYLFQSKDAVFGGGSHVGSQYRTFIAFVSPKERKFGMVDALREIISGGVAGSAKRRGRNENSSTGSSVAANCNNTTTWTVDELQVGAILRGATDKSSNLSQVLEAREFQTLVRKLHALTVSAHEAYRQLCLFYNTMAFGRHLSEVSLALSSIRPNLVRSNSNNDNNGNDNSGFQLPFFGAKTAGWYGYLRAAALETGKFAEHIDVDALAHRFGLETPPLLDLRTADTPYRPREDLFRFAKSITLEQSRSFARFANEHLPAEADDEEDLQEYGGGWAEDDDEEDEAVKVAETDKKKKKKKKQ